jgi:hypothetical protein
MSFISEIIRFFNFERTVSPKTSPGNDSPKASPNAGAGKAGSRRVPFLEPARKNLPRPRIPKPNQKSLLRSRPGAGIGGSNPFG